MFERAKALEKADKRFVTWAKIQRSPGSASFSAPRIFSSVNLVLHIGP